MIKRIFKPFYTTKSTGCGLGMSAVLGIISAHRGSLQLFSKPGNGTTFKVYIPLLNRDHTGVVAIQADPLIPWQGKGTILLVDDEEHIVTMAKILLEKMGFTVIGASSGKEALELYQKNASEITMVVTDIGMPVMTGYELFYKLKTIKPDLPVIICSGSGDKVIKSHIPQGNIAGIIKKPYNFDQLRGVLKKVVVD